MKRFTVLFAMIFLFSCVKSEGDKVTSGSAVVTKKEYTACSNNGAESSSANFLFFSNGTYKILIVNYDALNCVTGSEREMNLFYGQYSYSATTSKLTERLYKLEIAYLTTAEVSSRNTALDCGYSDWAIGVFRDATDNDDCIGGTIYSDSTATTMDAILNDTLFDDGQTIHYRVP